MIQMEGIKRIPLDRVMPYNEDDLLLFLSPTSALVIKSIKDDSGRVFSIRDLMEKNDVFACKDFERVVTEFKDKTLKARIERYFITKKVSYLFFDEEEQDFIKNVFEKNFLSAFVDLQSMEPSGKFKKRVIIENLPEKEFDKLFGSDLVKLKIPIFDACSVKMRYAQARRVNRDPVKRSKFNFAEKLREIELQRLESIFKKFPDLKVLTKHSFKSAFRNLSKLHHPDMEFGDAAVFKKLKDGVEILKKSSWYKNLPSGEVVST